MIRILYFALLAVLAWTNARTFFGSKEIGDGQYHFHGEQDQYLVKIDGQEIEQNRREVYTSLYFMEIQNLNEKNLQTIATFAALGIIALGFEHHFKKRRPIQSR